MPTTPQWRHYHELRPDELAALRDENPVAFWPLGLLEHHGWHLPVGFDGIKAERLCIRIAERTGGVILPRLQAAEGKDLQVGKDFFLAFSPERVDPGSANWTIGNTPKVIGGVTPRCLEAAQRSASQTALVVLRILKRCRPVVPGVRVIAPNERCVYVARADGVAANALGHEICCDGFGQSHHCCF